MSPTQQNRAVILNPDRFAADVVRIDRAQGKQRRVKFQVAHVRSHPMCMSCIRGNHQGCTQAECNCRFLNHA